DPLKDHLRVEAKRLLSESSSERVARRMGWNFDAYEHGGRMAPEPTQEDHRRAGIARQAGVDPRKAMSVGARLQGETDAGLLADARRLVREFPDLRPPRSTADMVRDWLGAEPSTADIVRHFFQTKYMKRVVQ